MREHKSNDKKQCMCCQHWGGPRKLGHFRDSVLVEDIQTKGECYLNRVDKPASQGCPKFEKWESLKD